MCPFCKRAFTLRWTNDNEWWVANPCEHLVLTSGIEIDPGDSEIALMASRAYNAPEGTPWPWRNGWPTPDNYYT